MLSLIFISLVFPYVVVIVAVRLVFMSFVICQFSVSIPLCLVHIIARLAMLCRMLL